MMSKTIFISIGEASGDFLGAQLISALLKQQPSLSIIGVGGPLMIQAGLKPSLPLSQLGIIGVFELIPEIRRILKDLQARLKAIVQSKPDTIITIDSWGFHSRLAGQIRQKLSNPPPIIHYAAPQVWASRPGRARKAAKHFDHLLTLFPFEPPAFTRHGLPTTCVGHPLIEVFPDSDPVHHTGTSASESAPLLILLPGSRPQELATLCPIFKKTIQNLVRTLPTLKVAIPVLPHTKDTVKAAFSDMDISLQLITSRQEKFETFQRADAALAASGTVALELALAKCPTVITYKVSRLTALLAKFFLKTPYVCLVNVLLKKPLFPELLQNRCHPDTLTDHILELLQIPQKRNPMIKDLSPIRSLLSAPKPHATPSLCAADIVLRTLKD